MVKKKSSREPLVKVNSSGRISLTLSRSVKPEMLQLIEHGASSWRLQKEFVHRMKLIMLAEIYVKYYTILRLDRVNRLLVTPAQGYALWLYWQDMGRDYGSPELGNLMMQLHQKLS